MVVPRFSPPVTIGDLVKMAIQFPRSRCRKDLVEQFERAFAGFLECDRVLAAPSARIALQVGLEELKTSDRDEVIVPSFTYAAMPAAIHAAGCRPVFADITPDTFHLDARSVESLITPRTLAVIPTHLFGQPCDLEPILNLAESRRILVIEDCAQSCGA
ncbi:aminotransferase class I/II-fold pyridoxal phosphate-dependent enzyme, partial [bacterium]|nr:aminotransferase class I/II-fold pyridoxal phosphate-dependent enzyme [candidate division CSSED10-310 bacterium]